MSPGPVTDRWADGQVDVEGDPWRYAERGCGDPVLVLEPSVAPDFAEGPLAQLAQQHRLLAPQLDSTSDPATSRAVAGRLAALAQALDVHPVAVVARGATTAAALWLAVDHPGQVSTLVLDSPGLFDDTGADGPDAELIDAMAHLEVPTLVLLGESAAGAKPHTAGRYRRLPASTVALVYSAGDEVRIERPDAYLAATADYLERGQAFVVNNRSSVLHA